MVGHIRIHESKNDKCWMFSIEASPVALKSFMEVKGYKYVEREICRSMGLYLEYIFPNSKHSL